MKKHFAILLFAVLALGLCVPPVFAQASGTVKGVCKDAQGNPDRRRNRGLDQPGQRSEIHPQDQQEGRVFFARPLARQVQRSLSTRPPTT